MLINPQIHSLTKIGDASDLSIGAEGVYLSTPIIGLDGLESVDVWVRFNYAGATGTSVKHFIQTSLDQGNTWIDLWCFAATTASKLRARALRPTLTGELTPADGTLDPDTVASVIVLGDRLRSKTLVDGTYLSPGCMLSTRAHVR